ncbi:MAG: molybdate transporter substrate-binding protein [Holophagaceae bacterium]|nr:molybdate transporter substrate-binding protein [Holophagaceae bacterium]
MKYLKTLAALLAVSLLSFAQAGDRITVAAAADLKFALDEVAASFRQTHPGDEVIIAYGSSGKAMAQIQQGAPFDLFFSADIAFPRELVKAGLAAGDVKPYAIGRLVIWSLNLDAAHMTLSSLADPRIQRIAIANPKHAPYGQRAEEALKATGMWPKIESRLVYGENISQTAQFAMTGNAQVGLIALSLVLNPEMKGKGSYSVIPQNLHQPLEQGYVLLKNGANKPLARQFATYMSSAQARAIMVKYGFTLPGEAKK